MPATVNAPANTAAYRARRSPSAAPASVSRYTMCPPASVPPSEMATQVTIHSHSS